MVLHAEGRLTLVFTLAIGLVAAQDTPPAPVCPQPAPICRNYEALSCEWALNMIPVYVCRTELGGLLGSLAGGVLGYPPHQQPIIYQPFSQVTPYPSFAQPQPIYSAYANRQYGQAAQLGAAREEDAQLTSQNGQVANGSQLGEFPSRASPQNGHRTATRDLSSSNGQPQPSVNPLNHPIGTHTHRQTAAPIYQTDSQTVSSAGRSLSAQPSLLEHQSLSNEDAE